MPPEGASDPVRNVLVFGETGVGKSSLINLVIGSNAAKTSPDADPCTNRTQPYDVNIQGERFKIWDTAGLDEGKLSGARRAAAAEKKLKQSLRKFLKNNDLSLLIYCVRGSRATRALVRHYQTISSETCNSTVPMVVVVTALENSSGDMESWWQRNAEDLSQHGMNFKDHACITTVGDDSCDTVIVRERRAHSQEIVRDLIFRNRLDNEGSESGQVLPVEGRRTRTIRIRDAMRLQIFVSWIKTRG
ncbi:hypothetical protein PAXRUDRAFT_30731 [Paxillus rubicundulus Ve08.2h10]|uniref:G domain-containing protein n=1 Tax=Paxillus rubicundulus Ve08.2h10 TaxID=930991 RepID=A0A0D0E449_9AGAM|nr:hypothetical protein PAXRUDRAFT_30731 [Paxillus rubicundulus Ve08.2h10]